jgi:hypothetical protein
MKTRTYEEIAARVDEVNTRLTLINREIEKELSRPFLDRCQFRSRVLDLNKKVCTAALEQLNWILNA